MPVLNRCWSVKLPRIDGNMTINKGGRLRRKAGGGVDGKTMMTTTATTITSPATT